MAWTNPPDELCDFENESWPRLGGSARRISHRRPAEHDLDPAAQLRAQHPRERHPVRGGERHQSLPARLRRRARQSQRHARPVGCGTVRQERRARHPQLCGVRRGAQRALLPRPRDQCRRPRRRLGGGELARCDLHGAQEPRDLRHQRHPSHRALLRRLRAAEGHLQERRLRRTGLRQRRADGRAPSWARANKAPRFAISALMDPGWPGHPGTRCSACRSSRAGWTAAARRTRRCTTSPAKPNQTAPRSTCAPARRRAAA